MRGENIISAIKTSEQATKIVKPILIWLSESRGSHDNKKSKVQFLSPQWSYRTRWPSWHYRQRNESSPLEGMTRYQQVNIHKLRPCPSDGSPRRSQSWSNTINIFTNSYIGRHQSIVFSREISNLWFDKYHVTINRGYSRNSLFIFTLS